MVWTAQAIAGDPGLVVACPYGIAARDDATWAAGASPGGLWHTRDAGASWQQTGHFKHVRSVLAPEEP